MRLTHRFLLIGAVTLLVPWAGCQYLREMEQALRHGQAQTLKAVATVTARAVRDQPDLRSVDPLRFGADRGPATDIYAFPLVAAPGLDGYADDWSLPDGSFETIRGAGGLRVRYQAGRTAAAVYLFLEVTDDEVIYGTGPGSDYVRIRVRNSSQVSTDLLFATPAPGLIGPVGASAQTHRRIQANWQPTSGGFNLEIRLPADIADRRLGFLVTDHDSDAPSRIVGTMPDMFSEPGWLIQPLGEITAELGRLVGDGLRLRVVDPLGYVLAEAGHIADSGPATESGFFYRVMRVALGGPPPGDAVRVMRPGRVDPEPITSVFRNEPIELRLADPEAKRLLLTSAQPLPLDGDITLALVAEADSELLLSLTDKAASRLFVSTLSVSLAATIALLAFAAWLSWRIRRLSRASRTLISRDQRDGPDLPESASADELGDLSRDLTRLLTQVGEYNVYLEGLGDKLTHELRTPLTIVATSLENLRSDTDPARGRLYLQRAQQGVERMQGIVTALGAARRVEEAIAVAEMETFDVAALVVELGAAYRASHPQRRIDVRVGAVPCPLHGAPELIAQMLDKLLENAVDFCPSDGTIGITLETRPESCVLSVSNTGSRLPDGQAERVFDSMFSARETDSRAPHLGLGLYIVQLIARRHDGIVAAENLTGGAGVGFRVTLPRLTD